MFFLFFFLSSQPVSYGTWIYDLKYSLEIDKIFFIACLLYFSIEEIKHSFVNAEVFGKHSLPKLELFC